MRNNIVTTTKKSPHNMSIILLCAGEGKRMKSYGVRSLISVNSTSIIDRQLHLIQTSYPQAEIVVVTGFEANKLRSALPNDKNIRVVENPLYETTGAIRSIDLAFGVARGDVIGIVYGDLVFNKFTLPPIVKESLIVTDKINGTMKSTEVGCIISQHDEVEKFDKDHVPKWGQICFLMGKELELCKKFVANPDKFTHSGWQMIDDIVCGKNGIPKGKIKAVSDPRIKIVDIDCVKDLDLARNI